MKDALASQDDTDPSVTVEVDPDADDPEASTLLDSIAQGGQAETDTDSEDTAPENRRARPLHRFCLNPLLPLVRRTCSA